MCSITGTTMSKVKKPLMSLKEFMLRTETLKLYRGFMRLRKYMEEPDGKKQGGGMRGEWVHWVRSEFRLRQHSATDEEAIKTLLVHGKRQLQEMERTILLATNQKGYQVQEPPSNRNAESSQNQKNQSCSKSSNSNNTNTSSSPGS